MCHETHAGQKRRQSRPVVIGARPARKITPRRSPSSAGLLGARDAHLHDPGPHRRTRTAAPVHALGGNRCRALRSTDEPRRRHPRSRMASPVDRAGAVRRGRRRGPDPVLHPRQHRCNVHVALLAALGPGETIVMARNGHKSAFAGLVLSRRAARLRRPVSTTTGSWPTALEPAELQRVLDAHSPSARRGRDGLHAERTTASAPTCSALADVCPRPRRPARSPTTPGASTTRCLQPALPAVRALVRAPTSPSAASTRRSPGSPRPPCSRVKGRPDRHRPAPALVFQLEQSTSASSLLLSCDRRRAPPVRSATDRASPRRAADPPAPTACVLAIVELPGLRPDRAQRRSSRGPGRRRRGPHART